MPTLLQNALNEQMVNCISFSLTNVQALSKQLRIPVYERLLEMIVAFRSAPLEESIENTSYTMCPCLDLGNGPRKSAHNMSMGICVRRANIFFGWLTLLR